MSGQTKGLGSAFPFYFTVWLAFSVMFLTLPAAETGRYVLMAYFVCYFLAMARENKKATQYMKENHPEIWVQINMPLMEGLAKWQRILRHNYKNKELKPVAKYLDKVRIGIMMVIASPLVCYLLGPLLKEALVAVF